MKILLKPFVALVIRYKSDDFFRARIRLTLLYTSVMTIVLLLFSAFLFMKVESQLAKLSTKDNPVGFLSKEEAISILQARYPTALITDIEEESLNDNLVYTLEMQENGQETDVYIDRVTGAILASAKEGEEVATFSDLLINDFEENIRWANAVILLVTIFLSYFLAGATLRPIQRKLKQQEQFSLDVAHEIRTPLSAILAAADSVLVKEESVLSYQETLVAIRHEALRLHTLSEDLLATAKSEHAIEFATVDMHAVMVDVIRRMTMYATQKNVKLEMNVQQPFFTMGNRTMLERMIENVLHNAIKFSHDGGVVQTEFRNKEIRISDTGVGMSPEHLAHVFERFYTVDIARSEHNKNGIGLGLSIVRQIANLHKITLKIDSKKDRGTVFSFTFLQ